MKARTTNTIPTRKMIMTVDSETPWSIEGIHQVVDIEVRSVTEIDGLVTLRSTELVVREVFFILKKSSIVARFFHSSQMNNKIDFFISAGRAPRS